MRVFKSRPFHRWATKEGLSDESLRAAVEEMEQGLAGADLGGHLLKKRVALQAGKSGGGRAPVAYETGRRAFFIYGFSKNARSNISGRELKALKRYAAELLAYDNQTLRRALEAGALVEVR